MHASNALLTLLAIAGVGGALYVIVRLVWDGDQGGTGGGVIPVNYSPGAVDYPAPAATTWAPPPAAAPYMNAIRQAEDNNGIPRNLLARLIQQESYFNPSASNPSGAYGIAQFMPATAAEWGVNRSDPFSSIVGAGRYLAWLYDLTRSWPLALAAYNWGIGNVQRKGIEAAPAETRNYLAAITRDVMVT